MKNKKLYNIPFWSSSVAFILGVVFFALAVCHLYWLLAIVIFLLIILLVVKKNKSSILFGIAALLLFFFTGGLRYQLSIPENQTNHIINQNNLDKLNTTLFVVTEIYKDSPKWKNYKIDIQQINGSRVLGSALLKVNCETNAKLTKGLAYASNLKFNKLTAESFPYGFSYNQYLKSQGITHQSWSKNAKFISIPNFNSRWITYLSNAQSGLNNALKKQNLDPEVVQFTQALVLGNKKELDSSMATNFAKAGVIHILAISGLHIGVIYIVFGWLLRQLLYQYKFRVARSIIVLVLLWVFVWFSGASDSALRAATMFSCFEFSRLLLRSQHPLNALMLSIFMLVLISPNILFSVGFQLSVTAVASIIIGVPKFMALWKPKSKLAKFIWGIVGVSFCAQLGLLPLSIYYFHQFPLLFLVANIPVMVFIPMIMGCAIFIVIGGYFVVFPHIISSIYNGCVVCLIRFVEWVASADNFLLTELYISKITVIAFYIILIYSRWLYSNFQRGFKYISIPLAFIAVISFIELNNKRDKNEVWLLNDFRNSTIIDISGNRIQIYSQNKLTKLDRAFKIQPISGQLHQPQVLYSKLKLAYIINNKKMLIVNDNFIPNIKENIDILVMSNSPKLNFERLLENSRPKQIVFAANNKKYLLLLWEKSCKKRGIPFYNVSKSGSLRLDAL